MTALPILSRRDWKLHYRHTYISVEKKETGIKSPFFIDEVRATDTTPPSRILGSMLTEDDWVPTIIEIPEYNIDLSFPELGAINLDKGCIYTERKVTRQWSKGLQPSLVNTTDLCEEEKHLLGFNGRNTSMNTMKAILMNTYPSVQEALSTVSNVETLARAFNRKFSFVIKRKLDYVLVFYKCIPIGWVENNEVNLPEYSHHIFEELSQYISCRKIL